MSFNLDKTNKMKSYNSDNYNVEAEFKFPNFIQKVIIGVYYRTWVTIRLVHSPNSLANLVFESLNTF